MVPRILSPFWGVCVGVGGDKFHLVATLESKQELSS